MQKKQTFMQRKEDISREWHLVDVEGKVLGRVTTEIAQLLIGKNKPTYTPHVDGGDYVVIVNASKVAVTRDKANKKTYYWHTGFPGGLKQMVFKDMVSQNPQRVMQRAVKNMLPKNKFRKSRLARLKVYSGTNHPYQDKLEK
jgi:large subunit ribosomal protein L13